MTSPARTASFTKKEISQLFLTAKRVLRHPGLDILLAPTKQTPGRLLIVTPAKIGIAPDRNRIRRRLKSIFKDQKLAQLPFDCVIIAKRAGINLAFGQLENLIKQAYLKIQSVKETDVQAS